MKKLFIEIQKIDINNIIHTILRVIHRILIIIENKFPTKAISKVLKRIRVIYEISALKLRIRILKIKKPTLFGLVQFVFNTNPEYLRISQNQVEIYRLLKYLEKNNIKPEKFLEIGTCGGGTLFLFCRIASKNAKIISVDLPGGVHGGGYPEWKIPIYKKFVNTTQELHLIRADSHKESTKKDIEKLLDSKKLDVLLIDGDHTYEGVKKDFKMYSPLVKKGGLIIFHDIIVHDPSLNCYVNDLWNEIKKDYKHLEIVDDWNQGYWGIGVLYNS